MLRALQTAKTAMQLQQTRIDVLANNLANVATSGFRQVLTQVAERASGGVDNPRAEGMALPAQARRSIGGKDNWAPQRDLTMTRATDTRPGDLNSTGRSTDVALATPGYFVVQDQEGNEFYTRDGAFHIDDAGRLTNASGFQVQGTSGPIQASGGAIEIGEDGTITVGGAARGRFKIVDFAIANSLQHRGGGVMAADEGQAPTAVAATEVHMVQGHIEGSNVDPVRTLIDMIAAQRAFEVHSKMLQASDESLGKTVNILGSTR